MNSDLRNRFLDRAEQALRFSNGNRHQSETSFLQQLMSELGTQALAPGLSPAELYRSVLYNRSSMHNAQDLLDVLATPSQRLEDALRPGDWMLRFVPGTGDVGHVSVITSDDLRTGQILAAEGIAAESAQPGYYGLVIESGASPHSRREPFARRLLDSRGRVPPNTLFLRPAVFQSDAPLDNPEVALPGSQSDGWGDIETAPPVTLPPARATTVVQAGFRPDISVLCPPPPAILERFEFDGSRPKAAHRTRIGTLAQEIVDSQSAGDPIHTLCILGHTDDIGNETDNQHLAARRAIAVATELEAAIESRRPGLAATLGLTVESRGEEAPLVPNTSTANRLHNRRVEIFLNRRWLRVTPAVGACPTVAVGPDPTVPTPFAVGEDSFSATITLFGTSIPVSGTVFYPADSAGSATPFATALTTLAPLVVFAHGNHATFRHPTDRFRESCGAGSGFVALENHRGYEYLQRVLAGMGMVAISVNANAANCTGMSPTNIQYRGALILAAIQHFQNLSTSGASRFVGKLDLARIALFGHSRGGEAVLVAAETLPTITSLSASRVLGVLSLAPTDAGATSGRPSGFAYLTILPAADGDVIENDGGTFYDQATPSPFKCQIYIDAANHNFFNRNWPLDEGHGAARLSRAEHESILLAYACAFFRGLLLGHDTLRFLRVDVLPPGVPMDKVHVSFEAGGATTIEDHENRNISLNTLGAPTTQSGGLTAAEFDFQHGVLSSFNRSFFGKTVGMVAQTSLAGGLFRSQLPAPVNLTGRELWVRAAEVYNGVAVPTTGTGFQIGLEDAAGGTSFVDSNDVGGLPRPFDRRDDDVARIGVDLTKTMLKTQRFAAACFVRSGFDPTHVRAVLLRLDRGDGRALAFDQLQVV